MSARYALSGCGAYLLIGKVSIYSQWRTVVIRHGCFKEFSMEKFTSNSLCISLSSKYSVPNLILCQHTTPNTLGS
jgi:hypothetical protein